MRMFTKLIAAAGLVVTAVAASASPAEAQRYGHRYDRQEHRYDHRYERHGRWDRGRHHGWNRARYNRHHRACWREWRRGHRVTVCR